MTSPDTPHRLPTLSASQLSQQRSQNAKISSGSEELDKLLGGKGYVKGQVMEICGPPGSGKTALALQAAANVLNSREKVVWIDTSHPTPQSRLDMLLNDSISTSNVTFQSAPSLAHLLALILHPNDESIPPGTTLLVIDNMSTPYSVSFPPGMEGTSGVISKARKIASARRFPIMTDVFNGISKLAATRNMCILVLQQMTTRVATSIGGVLQPAITQQAWGNSLPTRIMVYRSDLGRFVAAMKVSGRTWEEGEGPIVSIQIGDDGGIEDGGVEMKNRKDLPRFIHPEGDDDVSATPAVDLGEEEELSPTLNCFLGTPEDPPEITYASHSEHIPIPRKELSPKPQPGLVRLQSPETSSHRRVAITGKRKRGPGVVEIADSEDEGEFTDEG